MGERTVETLIEELSDALVLEDACDAQAAVRLRSRFVELAKWAVESSRPAELAAIEAVCAMLAEVEAGRTQPAPVMEAVGRTVSALQAAVREGRAAKLGEFPAELGLPAAQGPAASSGAVRQPAVLPANVDEEIFAEFLARQSGVLEDMEAMILSVERAESKETVAALKRLIHTLKGEAALLGLVDVERLCHRTEDLLGQARAGERVDFLLGVKDWLAKAFGCYAGKGDAPEPVEHVLRKMADLDVEAAKARPSGQEVATPASESSPADAPPAAPAAAAAGPTILEGDPALKGEFVCEAREHLESVDLHLLTLETEPESQEALNAVFRAFHTIKGVAGFLELSDIRSLAHEAEGLLDRARRGELKLVGPAVDAAFDAADTLKKLVQHVSDSVTSGSPLAAEAALPALLARLRDVASGKSGADRAVDDLELERFAGKKLGEILVERGAASPGDVEKALNVQHDEAEGKKLGEILVGQGQASARNVAQALRIQKAQETPKQSVNVKEAVKVDADRLDRLVDTIGELVIAETMFRDLLLSSGGASDLFVRRLGQLDKITRELQEMGTSLRMVPVRATFQKMARLVRDLAKKVGKKVELVMAGEDTELDKSVVDMIGDPLVHMVRNAVDHGLESSSEERVACGKPATGRVDLRAFHKGGNIFIEIEDDGRGLDREAIVAKARERGLIRDGDALTDREIYGLIFEPGFSTAQKVTDVSGRGVGMDVVRRNIEALRGQVEIRSERGRGTCFSIRLPLTLAIIDGMVVRVAQERYIIPTLSIVRTVRPGEADITTVLNRGEMISMQGQLISVFRLHRLFGIDGATTDPTKAVVVIVEDDGKQAGLMVDELLGQQQIVIKSLGEAMKGVLGIAGGAVMPDGTVGLILDVGGVVKLTREDGRREEQPPASKTEPAALAAGA